MEYKIVKMIEALLADPTNLNSVSRLVSPDVVYVSLNFDNPDLKRIMPWAGTAHGPQSVVDTYTQVGKYWTSKELTITDRLEMGDKAAIFGHFTYESKTQRKTIKSPFCIFVRVADGRIAYMQFMEDTFGTASTFKADGQWQFRSNPEGEPVEL